MTKKSTAYNHPNRYLSVRVPDEILSATVELLSFRGAPVFIGTELAKLILDDKTLIIRSQMSGVVNRVSVDNGQIVSRGDDLFELRNINTVRDKAGHKLEPRPVKRNQSQYDLSFLNRLSSKSNHTSFESISNQYILWVEEVPHEQDNLIRPFPL